MLEDNSYEAVLKQGDRLSAMLKSCPEVLYFKQCEEKLRTHTQAQALLKKMKLLQKEVVNLEHLGKKEALKQKSEELQQCQNELDVIPLVSLFFEAQEELNHLLQSISQELTLAVADCMKE